MTTATEVADVVDLTVVPKRHPWRWISGIVVLLIATRMLFSVLGNERFGWDTVRTYLRDVSIGQGLVLTLWLTVACMAIDANTLITPTVAAILGLGLNEAAYMSEIVRAGILSVDHGQQEAASALGLTRLETMRRIILPQAMRVVVPPTGNETIGMLKTTSLVSVMAVHDLLYSAQIISARNYQVIPMLIVASIWYLIITTVLTIGQFYLERRFARGERTLPLTPIQKLRRLLRTHAPAIGGSK